MSPTSTQRDELLDWAVSTGRVPGHKRAAWASLYDRDPVGTTRQIGRMSGQSRTAAAAAPSASSGAVFPRLADGQERVTLTARDYEVMRLCAERGVDAAASARREHASGGSAAAARPVSAPAASAPVTPAASSTAAHATRDEQTGDLSFRGFPVAMGAAGEPCVFTSSGWMGVAAFAASGLGDEDLRGALVSARLVPSSPTARAFEAGPPGGQAPSDNPLFRGGG